MLNDAIPRYRPTYRMDEIDLVIRLARRGESLGFMGIAGVGKSNIVNFLRDIQRNIPQVGSGTPRLHFPVVDAVQWQGTAENLWKMMLEALNKAMGEGGPPVANSKVIPFSDEERLFNGVQGYLHQICQERHHQVMFILDDFDQILERGPLPMLEQLNVLRSEGNRGLLSYLVFTKRLPHILGQNHPLENRSKFYDLFRHHIYALAPYTQDDALRMLQHLNQVAGDRLADNQLEQIYQLAGGHAGLLKLVFNVWAEGGASGLKAKYFAEKPEIKQECQRILESLHEQEQEALLALARGTPKADQQHILDHLVRRGILVKLEPVTWFSPLMAQCLSIY